MDTNEYDVKAERIERGGLQRKLDDLQAMACDLQSQPTAQGADALMHMTADVLLTLRLDAADRAMAGLANGVA